MLKMNSNVQANSVSKTTTVAPGGCCCCCCTCCFAVGVQGKATAGYTAAGK